jgi:biopolymer transport protein ExbD
MASMIDVVFLLLIFFLTTTTFVQSEKQLAAEILVDNQDSQESQRDLEPAIVAVWNDGNGVSFRAGTLVTNDQRQVEDWLERFRFKDEGAFIQVGSGVEFQVTTELISACRRFGFARVTYVPDSQ